MHMTTDVTRPDVRADRAPLTEAQRDEALRHEWLLTNGLGGYAMGTLLGANTRRYHGLLIAATHPPVSRLVVLHAMIEQLVIRGKAGADDETIDLSTHAFGRDFTPHPDGWRTLTGWTLDVEADRMSWFRTVGTTRIRKTLIMIPGRNAVYLEYDVRTDREDVHLRIRPLVPLRDYHDLVTDHTRAPLATSPNRHTLRVTSGFEQVHFAAHIETTDDRSADHAPDPVWTVDPEWWRDFAYARDAVRGQGFIEHIWSPGQCGLEIPASTDIVLRIDVTLEQPAICAAIPRHNVIVRDDASEAVERLGLATEQFIALREDGGTWSTTILAGFPWFADWGRDAMISIPGLLIETGRLDEARSTLELFARHRRNGLIPNRFDDYGHAPHYNTVDASLWFIHAVWCFEKADTSGDSHADLLDACAEILDAYGTGTNYGIKRDVDGLIISGNPTTQLTWMDAKRDGVVFTPRHGKAIEINALYYNALCAMAEITERGGDSRRAAMYRELAGQTAIAVQMNFWWSEESCCHDVLLPNDGMWEPDGHLRPNQIFAVSLPFSPLTPAQQHDVVAAVREHLLTPFGLRTLDPRDPLYVGRYEGDLMKRDAAYHNGTVWPWLIGHYCDALDRVEDDPIRSRQAQRRAIETLIGELDHQCIQQIAEVYDGDAPHRAAGCPAQAWSVAELFRIAKRVM
jgi:predicted glycogen debranching enzyme